MHFIPRHSTPRHTFYTPAYYIPTCIFYTGMHIIPRHTFYTPACILYPNMHFIPRHAFYTPACILYPGMNIISRNEYYIPKCILYTCMHIIFRHAYYTPVRGETGGANNLRGWAFHILSRKDCSAIHDWFKIFLEQIRYFQILKVRDFSRVSLRPTQKSIGKGLKAYNSNPYLIAKSR